MRTNLSIRIELADDNVREFSTVVEAAEYLGDYGVGDGVLDLVGDRFSGVVAVVPHERTDEQCAEYRARARREMLVVGRYSRRRSPK